MECASPIQEFLQSEDFQKTRSAESVFLMIAVEIQQYFDREINGEGN
jgi:hypothetical protein